MGLPVRARPTEPGLLALSAQSRWPAADLQIAAVALLAAVAPQAPSAVLELEGNFGPHVARGGRPVARPHDLDVAPRLRERVAQQVGMPPGAKGWAQLAPTAAVAQRVLLEGRQDPVQRQAAKALDAVIVGAVHAGRPVARPGVPDAAQGVLWRTEVAQSAAMRSAGMVAAQPAPGGIAVRRVLPRARPGRAGRRAAIALDAVHAGRPVARPGVPDAARDVSWQKVGERQRGPRALAIERPQEERARQEVHPAWGASVVAAFCLYRKAARRAPAGRIALEPQQRRPAPPLL